VEVVIQLLDKHVGRLFTILQKANLIALLLEFKSILSSEKTLHYYILHSQGISLH